MSSNNLTATPAPSSETAAPSSAEPPPEPSSAPPPAPSSAAPPPVTTPNQPPTPTTETSQDGPPTTSSVTWVTATITPPVGDSGDAGYPLTLYASSIPIITVTIFTSPSLHLVVGDLSIQAEESPLTTDNIVLSLQDSTTIPNNGPTISPPSVLFYSDTTAQSSTPSQSTFTTIEPFRETLSNVPDPSPSISSGAIAGIAIAAVLLIALVIGGWFFWRRKKKKAQQPTTALTDDELARREGDGDKIVLGPHQAAPTTGAYQTQYQEMSGNGLAQELDRSHSYKHAVGGAHELKAEDRPAELPFAGIEEHGSTNDLDVVDGGESEVTQVPQTDRTATQAPQVSPHVEAQRRREVEWLEAEEMRMRQRREALLQQSGGKTEQ